jgi:hypothetical protein
MRDALVRGWERFWFARTSTSTAALVRIAVGFVVFLWTATFLPDVMTYFSENGILRRQISAQWSWGILRTLPGLPAVVTLYALLLIASVCLIVGFHSRLASVIVFLGVLSLERRNAYIFNAGDLLVRLMCLYVMLMPSGAALSVDRWRKAKDRFWEFPLRSQWAVRLVQLQFSVLYAATVWEKVRGTAWNDGTAVSYALRVGDYIRFTTPSWIWNNEWIVNLLTWGTLAIEFSLAFLVWNRRLRPWVLLAGVALHLGIELTIQIGYFSLILFAGYLAFIPPETADKWIASVRSRMARSRLSLLRKVASPPSPMTPVPLEPVAATPDAAS